MDAPEEDGSVIHCTVTTGFFVLGHCGRPAVTACQCGRQICAGHVGPGGLCPECTAAQAYGRAGPYDPAWTPGYRRVFYQRSAQSYQDTTWYSTFDGYDRGAFEPGQAYAPDYGPDEGGGFVDS
jgi:hypothetical protein